MELGPESSLNSYRPKAWPQIEQFALYTLNESALRITAFGYYIRSLINVEAQLSINFNMIYSSFHSRRMPRLGPVYNPSKEL